MTYKDFHPEDVKAAIRKRFKSLDNFEREHALYRGAVHDLLRGKSGEPTARVVDAVLVMEGAAAAPKPTVISGYSRKVASLHRLNEKAA